jgi:hypothetical protein
VQDPDDANNSPGATISITVQDQNFPPCFTFAETIVVAENTGTPLGNNGALIPVGPIVQISDDTSNIDSISFHVSNANPSHLGSKLISEMFGVEVQSVAGTACPTTSPCTFQMKIITGKKF